MVAYLCIVMDVLSSWSLFGLSSEGHLHISCLILEVALGVVASIAVVVLIVPSSCVVGVVAGIISIIVLVSILVIGVLILTFVIWLPNVSFVDLEFIITEADINLVDFIHPSLLMVCL